jgi:hypothetical protein
VLKKAQFLVVAIVAALMVPTASLVCLDYGKTQVDWSTVSSFTQAAASSPLPDLSESVAPGSASAPENQTDNTTATVASGGAVKASFTVISRPLSNQGGSGTSSIGSVASDPNSASATAPAQVVNGVAVDGWTTQNDPLDTAADVRPKSSGLARGWVLLVTTWLVGIAAVGVLAFRHGRAKE